MQHTALTRTKVADGAVCAACASFLFSRLLLHNDEAMSRHTAAAQTPTTRTATDQPAIN